MQYVQMKDVKNPLSKIVYGTAIQTMLEGGDATDILDAIYAAGINTFDTAQSYMKSEVSLGNWVEKRGIRDKVNILTKGCLHNEYRSRITPYDIRSDLADSLAKLGMESVDLYLLHRDDPKAPVGPIVETLNELHAKGTIGAFGGSNWTHMRITEANEYANQHGMKGFTLSSPCFSIAEQIGDPSGGSVHISGPSNEGARQWYMDNAVTVLPYSGFARGFLSGKYHAGQKEDINQILPPTTVQEYYYPVNIERLRRVEEMAERKQCTAPQIALAWLLAQPLQVHPIISPSSREHLESDLQAFEIELTKEECDWLAR